MSAEDVAWTVEEACLNAWPAPRQLIADGWLLRLSGGSTRRTNSVNPLRVPHRDVGAIFDRAARIYAERGQPLIFRVPSLAADLDNALAARGLMKEDECCTLAADLASAPAEHDPVVSLGREAEADWLAFRSARTGCDACDDAVFDAMLDHIVPAKACAAVRIDGAIAAAAYGVVDGAWLVINAVATDPAHRNRGWAGRTVAALMRWGRSEGATGAALQVVADNAPARALYARLGFTRELYRYHYRRVV